MKIASISVYSADLTYAGDAYSFAGGRSHQVFPSVVVAITTDVGVVGYGEVSPCGPNYMPAYAEGIPSAIELLAPHIIGLDPRDTSVVYRKMNLELSGQQVAKAALDMACWDILGKATGLPVYTLLGGLQAESMPVHRIVPLADFSQMQESLEQFRSEGFRSIQIKLGHDVDQDVAMIRQLSDDRPSDELWVGDINGAWRRDEAIRFSHAVSDVDLYLEQPSRSFDEVLSVRGRLIHPLKLDESLNSVEELQRAIREDAMDAISLKVSKFGGLTVSRVIRDICVDAGIPMTIEDAWGSSIATAAFAHLAASTPAKQLLNTTDLDNYNTTKLAEGGPVVRNGRMFMNDRPGLGVEPDFEMLTPVAAHE